MTRLQWLCVALLAVIAGLGLVLFLGSMPGDYATPVGIERGM